MRSVALVDGTEWVDSEVELVLWGPNTWGADASTRPQMGTVHRYGTANGKQWGFVFWWNIFIFGPDVWNAAMWGSDDTGGTNFNNASGVQYSTATLQDRTAYSVRATRTSSFGWIHDHYLTSDGINRLKYLPSAAPITITEATDTTRTITGVSRVNGDANITFPTNTLLPQDVGKRLTGTGITAGTTVATVSSATAGTISANATSTSSSDLTISDYVTNPTVFNMSSVNLNGAPDIGGSKLQFVPADQTTGALDLNQRMKMTPSNLYQRFFPIVASSRLVGNRLQGRVARLGERLPEWEDSSRVLTLDLVAPTNLPSGFTAAGINSIPATAGRCGIVFAHSVNPNYMESGLFKAKKL